MGWPNAIFSTIGLIAIPYLIGTLLSAFQLAPDTVKLIEGMIGVIIIVGSAAWVYSDSSKVEISKYEGMINGEPIALALFCALIWLAFMPMYLQKRWMIKNQRAQLRPEFHPNYKRS